MSGTGSLTELALSLVLTATFFYVLYFVVRAAVRDGVRHLRTPGVDSKTSPGAPQA